MKLIKELINKEIQQYQEFQNIRHYLISAWNLHMAYLICINFIDYKVDSKEKNYMFSRMFLKIYNKEYEEAEKILYKINEFAQDEIKVINDALSKLNLQIELLKELGDINPERYKNYGFVAVLSSDAP